MLFFFWQLLGTDILASHSGEKNRQSAIGEDKEKMGTVFAECLKILETNLEWGKICLYLWLLQKL